MRTRLRLFLPAAAALVLAGCLPGSSGPSIPPIPSGAHAPAAASSPAARPQAVGNSKKFSPRTIQKTQTAPRARPSEAE